MKKRSQWRSQLKGNCQEMECVINKRLRGWIKKGQGLKRKKWEHQSWSKTLHGTEQFTLIMVCGRFRL